MATSKVVIFNSTGKVIPFPTPPTGTLCEYRPMPQLIPSCPSYLVTKLAYANGQPMQSQLQIDCCTVEQISKETLAEKQNQHRETLIMNIEGEVVAVDKLQSQMVYFRLTKQYHQCVTIIITTEPDRESDEEEDDELEEYVVSAVNFDTRPRNLSHAEKQIKDCMKRPTQWTEIQAWEQSMVECGCLARFKVLQYENTLSLPRSHMQEITQSSVPINPFPDTSDKLYTTNLPSNVKAAFVPIFAQSLDTDDIVLKLELPYRGLYAYSLQSRSAEVFDKVVQYHNSKCGKETSLKETGVKMVEEWWLLCPTRRHQKVTDIAKEMYSRDLREKLREGNCVNRSLEAFDMSSAILLNEEVNEDSLLKLINTLSKMDKITTRSTTSLPQLLRSEQYFFSANKLSSAAKGERDERMNTLEKRFTDFCKLFLAKEMERHLLPKAEMFNWFKTEIVPTIIENLKLPEEEIMSYLKNELRFLEYDYDSDDVDGEVEEFLLDHTRKLLTRSTMLSLTSKLSARQPFLVQFPVGCPQRGLMALFRIRHSDQDAALLRRWTEMCFDITPQNGPLCDVSLSQTNGSITLSNTTSKSPLYASICILNPSGVMSIPVDCALFANSISFSAFQPDSTVCRITDFNNVGIWCISVTVTESEFHINPSKHSWLSDSQLNLQRKVLVIPLYRRNH
eukprot:TRINITY_DN6487_c0_g1_i1.p1 TRINITY_DN6487_c0_g1~~TRINITY_DN6487_c0_g1_i1.p1  ORF type:complete len:758 (+),score=168.62 TRINITY_DN6487_c0_g1_i1:246-2276(+)